MEPLSAGELERLLDDFATRSQHGFQARLEILRVEDDQGPSALAGLALGKPSNLAAAVFPNPGVTRPVVVKGPAEDRAVEIFGLAQVGHGELDVVDGVVLMSHVQFAFTYGSFQGLEPLRSGWRS